MGFTTCLKLSEGFSRLAYSLGFAVFAIASFVLLSRATLVLPMGTAYAVWTGIGAFGTALVGVFVFGEPANAYRLACLVVLVGSIVGLRATVG